MRVLEFLEQTSLSKFIHESSSMLGFPAFLCIHVLGLSFLAGLNGLVSVRMLGIAPTIPLQPLKRLFPYMWLGFILTVISGGGLAAAKATTMFVNPILLTKLVLIFFAIIIMRMMEKRIASGAPASSMKMLAGAELFLWVVVMVLGRLIAYSGTILGFY